MEFSFLFRRAHPRLADRNYSYWLLPDSANIGPTILVLNLSIEK
jgi:hypothetical protein